MRERPYPGGELITTPDRLVSEVSVGRVPELSPSERAASVTDFVIELDRQVEEAVRYNSYGDVARREIESAAELVHSYFSRFIEAGHKRGDNFRAPELENYDEALVRALVTLFRELPEVRRFCTESPEQRLYAAEANDFNPVYVAYQRAVRRLSNPPVGEDPQLRRTRANYVKMFNDLTATIETTGGNVRSLPLDIDHTTPEQIAASATAMLELVRADMVLYSEARLQEDADVVCNFLEILVDPNAARSRHSGEKQHATVEKIINTAYLSPPQLGLNELPERVFNAALRLRAFSRNFNLACLGHDTRHMAEHGLVGSQVYHQGNGDMAANPFNLAGNISARRAKEQPFATSMNELMRLQEWETLVPAEPAYLASLEGSVVRSYEDTANVTSGLIKSGEPQAKGFFGKALDSVKGGAARVARLVGIKAQAVDRWDAERVARKKEGRRRAVEMLSEYFAISFQMCKEHRDPSALVDPVRQLHDRIVGAKEDDLLRPEIMEAAAGALQAVAADVDPAFSDYWQHINTQLVNARDQKNLAASTEWSRFILENAVPSAERIKTARDNTFYYPDQPTSVREKKNYKRKIYIPYASEQEKNLIVESVFLPSGENIFVHKDGKVYHWVMHSTGHIKNYVSVQLPYIEGGRSVEKARFLPPDGTVLLVYASDNVLLEYTVKLSNGSDRQWLLSRTIHNHLKPGINSIVFSFDSNHNIVYGDKAIEINPKNKDETFVGDWRFTTINHGSREQHEVVAAGPHTVVAVHEVNSYPHLTLHYDKNKHGDSPESPYGDIVITSRNNLLSPTLVDAQGQFVFNNDSFYAMKPGTKTFELAGTIDKQKQRVLQLLPGGKYLVETNPTGNHSAESHTLQIATLGTEEKTHVARLVGPKLGSARVRSDGSVLVALKDGTIEIYDGEPVQTETIDERLIAVAGAIKALNDRPNLQYLEGGAKKGGVKITIENGKDEEAYYYNDVQHAKLVRTYEGLFATNKSRFESPRQLDGEAYAAAEAELRNIEYSLKADLTALCVLDNEQADPRVRLESLISLIGQKPAKPMGPEQELFYDLYAKQKEVYVRLTKIQEQTLTLMTESLQPNAIFFTQRVKNEGLHDGIKDLYKLWVTCSNIVSGFYTNLRNTNVLFEHYLPRAISANDLFLQDRPLSAYINNGKISPIVKKAAEQKNEASRFLLDDFEQYVKIMKRTEMQQVSEAILKSIAEFEAWLPLKTAPVEELKRYASELVS